MIYCVEDDDDIRALMLYTLRTAGFEAQGFPDSVLFWKAMEEEQPKLILLDIMLPVDDGLTILKSLRSNGMTKDIPVIMTTAKGTEFDKVKGLDLGADDYLVKPFGMMEMISRIKAVLRRTSNQEQETHLTIKNLSLDAKNYTVRNNGQKIELTLKEFDLLSLLGDARSFREKRHPPAVFHKPKALFILRNTGSASLRCCNHCQIHFRCQVGSRPGLL